MNCNDAVAALTAFLETGEPMTDAQREHIRTCSRCRALLDSAKEFETLLEGNGVVAPEVDATVNAAEDALRRKRMRRVVMLIVGIPSIVLLAIVTMLLPFGQPLSIGQEFFFVVVAMLIAIAFAVPIVGILLVLRGASKRRIYKRLRSNKQLSGICLGIAESFGWNVTYVRFAFIALFFFDGLGFWLYLIFDLALPVHPDDRSHLWRFRFQRWLRAGVAPRNERKNLPV